MPPESPFLSGLIVGLVLALGGAAVAVSRWRAAQRDLALHAREAAALEAANERLQETRDQLQAVLDAMPGGISWISSDLIYLGINRYLATLLHEAPETLVGQPVGLRDTNPAFRDYVQSFFAATDPMWSREVEIALPDEEPRSYLLRLQKYQEGRAAVVVGVDLTEQKRTEEALRQAQRLEAIGLLAGGIAHDFNNLLTVINGFTELALPRVEEDPLLQTYLREVHGAGERAAGLTRQLLAFGRRQVFHPEVLDLGELVEGMIGLLRSVVGEGIAFHVQREAEARVQADPSQLEQVILNLVVNARDAMPNGGNLRVVIRGAEQDSEFEQHHPDEPSGTYVQLVVSDTGIGMDAETQARIFEPFFTTKAPGRGTGLGLASVYGILAQSGGSIRVQSTPGEGTTFVIDLPRTLDPVAPLAEATGSGAPSTTGETILVVEDEEGVRELVEGVLTGAGYRVLVATDGAAALELARRSTDPIDLLLADVVLPGLPGPEVARQLHESQPSLRWLYMSGYPERSAASPAPTAWLRKPFGPSQLLTRVREVLDAD